MTDASNNSLPVTHPVVCSVPPLPSVCARGDRTSVSSVLAGRIFDEATPVLVYPSGKQVVCRILAIATSQGQSCDANSPPPTPPLMPSLHPTASVVIYRGHVGSTVTAACLSRSGCYMASGDAKGCFKVWALDHPDHRCRYQTPTLLTGSIRDIDWDSDNSKIVVGGERSPADTSGSSACAKVLTWDTGVTNGTLSAHTKGRCTSVAFKPNRPFRVVTSGRDDAKLLFHAGPPFTKLNATAPQPPPTESAHAPGSVVHKVVYQPTTGRLMASVGSDRSLCFYHGTTGVLQHQVKQAHQATIYDVAWNASGSHVLTASGDGTCKLWTVVEVTDTTGAAAAIGGDATPTTDVSVTECKVWNVAAEATVGQTTHKVPLGCVQTGCTFVSNGTIPVATSFNGQIHILHGSPTSSLSTDSSTSAPVWCQTITGHVAAIAACTVAPGESNTFFTGDTDGVICQWTWNAVTKTCTPVRRLEPPSNATTAETAMHVIHTGAICGAAVVVDNDENPLLWTIGWDDVVVASKLSIKTSTNLETTVQPDPTPLGAQPSTMASGTQIACIATVKGLVVGSTKNGTAIPHSPAIMSIPYDAQAVCVSPDDTTVYVGGKDGKIYIYSVVGTTLTLKYTIENGHLKPIHSLALSHDGTKLASADEKDICVWDITGAGSNTYTALVGRGKWCFHVQRVTALAWSLDDRVLASGGADDSIYVWTLGKQMTRLHYPYAHRGGIVSLHFVSTDTANDLLLLSTGADSVVNVWDITADVKAKFG